MKKYKTIREFTFDAVDNMLKGDVFTARDICRKYNAYVFKETQGEEYKLPYDDTVGRLLRERRANLGDVFYFDYGRSMWWKNDHIATAEERKAYGV